MKLSREDVQRIAQLVKLGLNENEVEQLSQLSDILDNMEILKQVDTTDVPPSSQSVSLQNIFRADEAIESYPKDEILANAPQTTNAYFKVKAVLEE